DPLENFHIAMKWRDNIGSGNPFLPPEPVLEEIARTQPEIKILNMNCNDVSKRRVDSVFEEIFGYSLSVDPGTYSGKCVMKANGNGLHLGEIIECPTEIRKKDFVYEKLINNEVGNGLVEDIRVPIFSNKIPFVYLKYRPVRERLVDRGHTLKQTVIAKVSDALTENEVEKIFRFCAKMRLDYGEIDVLRDRDTQKIFIVDVNNDPCGPPFPAEGQDARKALDLLILAFEKTFLRE
ncbi:MAG: hypothetical protein OEM58_13235, partial [Nitrospirota bacterium]|nr:hypothetical protein [Nitrospirota bacterium]